MATQTIWTPRGDVPVLLAQNNNLTATTDPGVSNDNTQGYSIGSVWVNTTSTALRWWECFSNATGAAVWMFSGASYANGGSTPSTEVVQFGMGTALAAAEGNISRQISATGVSPGGTAVDSVLAVYSLPAGSFDANGRGLTLTAIGSFGATANNKTVKIIFNATTAVVGSAVTGGTTVATTGVVATNSGGWWLSGNVFKYGVAGSNTQMCTSNGSIAGSSHGGTTAPALSTATESGAILIAITGNAATATTDILFSYLEINAMN